MISPILSTFNVQESLNFYKSNLNFEENWVMRDDDGTPNFVGVRMGDGEILLGTIDFVEQEFRESLGKGIQIYVEVPLVINIDTIYENAISKKTKILKEIEDREWGERAFVVEDPNGYNIMLAQRKEK